MLMMRGAPVRNVCLVALVGFACRAEPDPCAVDGSPTTIDALVGHIDSLPRPVDTACLIRSLERSLQVESSTNPFSAQPALSRNSPRIFLFSGELAISVVPEGIGAEVVEFG